MKMTLNYMIVNAMMLECSEKGIVIKCSKIIDEIDILNDGALDIDMAIQDKVSTKDLYQPQSILTKDMMKLLEDLDKADVSFDVRGKMFRAHSLILHANAPIFLNFCIQGKDESAMAIIDTTPDIFYHILENVYTEVVQTNKVVIKVGQEVLDAANRYGLVCMKVVLEIVLVQEGVVNS